MREIRFRAWDLDNLEMRYSGVEEDNTECKGYREPNQVLMQFTGLKDKNGREIYEGDVVKFSQGQCWVMCEVTWNEFYTGYFPFIGGSIVQFSSSDCGEVIGNIYENPELLK